MSKLLNANQAKSIGTVVGILKLVRHKAEQGEVSISIENYKVNEDRVTFITEELLKLDYDVIATKSEDGFDIKVIWDTRK